MTCNRQRNQDEPSIANRIRWFYLILTGLVWLGLLAPAYGQTVNLQFNATANVPNPSSVSSCSAFTLEMNYGVVSPVTGAQGAKITLPLKGFTYNSIVPNPDVASSVVQGTSPNDSLVVTMINPLSAGKSGTVTVSLQFPCGMTCNGQTSALQARFTATNASAPITSGSTSLTASATDPVYKVNVVTNTYSATTRYANLYVRLSPTNSSLVNFLPLTTPVMSVTVPTGAIIRLYGTTGTRSGIPNSLPATAFTPTSTSTTVGSNTVLTWTNIPTFYRGGSLDIRNFELEFPAAQFPYGTVVPIRSSMSGLLGEAGCTGAATANTGLFNFTVTAPGSITAGAAGCSGVQMLYGQNNTTYNAIYTGKVNQTRITIPLSNTGNVTLTNLIHTLTVPTNEIAVTQVYGTGTSSLTGTAAYRTNLNATYVSVGTVGQGVANRIFPALGTGEYITDVRVTTTSMAAGANMSLNVLATQLSPLRSGSAVNAAPLASFVTPAANQTSCFGGYTCITAQATVTAEYSGTLILNQTCSSSRVVVQPNVASVQNLSKAIQVVSAFYVPGQTIQYRMKFTPVTAGDSLRNFVITDALPTGLEYVGNVKYSHTTTPPPTGVGSYSLGTALPQFSQLGQTLTWSWAANASPNNRINSTADHYIYFNVRIRPGAGAGTYTNCITATGSNLSGSPVTSTGGNCAFITVSSVASMQAVKWVRGDLDRNYVRFPQIGHTTDGGKSDYRFVLINTGNIAFKNITLIDILPWVGDQVVAADFERLSEWRPSLLQAVRFYPKAAADSSKVTLSPITAPLGLTVSYSTSTNPCRTEFNPPYSPAGCVSGSWTTTAPTPLSATQAFKMTLAGPFAAGDTIVFGVDMRSPLGTLLDKVAWNSFAYQVARNDNSSVLPVAEPNKVGIDVKRFPSIGDYVWQDLNNNGRQDEPASEGVNGVTVKLFSPGGDGVIGGTDDFLVGTRLTANDGSGNPGYYKFDSLFAESYYVRFTPLVGRGFTYQNAGGVPDNLNSDADSLTGQTILTVLDPNENDFTWDAGMCFVPDGGPDQLLCSPATSVKLPTATGNNTWYSLGTNPPGATINSLTGQVTGLSGGLYKFILRTAPGCSDTVTVNRRPLATALASALTVCAGESITLSAQPASASATYAWTGPSGYSASGQTVIIPNATATQSGSYTLTVNDTGCVSATTVAVTVNVLPTLTATNNGPLTCAKASVQLTAGGSGVTYRWDGPASFSATSATATTGQPGLYTVVTTGANGCTAVATTTVAQDNTLPVITAVPTACNPATNQYTVNGTITLSQPGGGPLVVTDGASSLTLTVGASQTSVVYSLTGLTSDVGSHTVTAGFATAVCAPSTVTYAAPASCSCVVSVTFTAGVCQFNQTNTTTTDDYHRPMLRATNTVPGTTGRYEVVLNANANGTGGTVLNPGGTTYGQSVVVGTPGQFKADGTTSYNLTIRDSNTSGCRTTLATPPVASCPSCLPLLCPPITIVRRAITP